MYTSFVVLCEKKILANPRDENVDRAILSQRLQKASKAEGGGVVVGMRVQQDGETRPNPKEKERPRN